MMKPAIVRRASEYAIINTIYVQYNNVHRSDLRISACCHEMDIKSCQSND